MSTSPTTLPDSRTSQGSPSELPIDETSPDQRVQVTRISPNDSQPTRSDRKKRRKQRKDYLTAEGHVNVDYTRKHHGEQRGSQATTVPTDANVTRVHRTLTKKDPAKRESDYLTAQGHVIVFEPKANRIDPSVDGEDQQYNETSTIDLTEETKSEKHSTASPRVDVTLVRRDQAMSSPKDKCQKAKERIEYLFAEGHVNVDHSKRARNSLPSNRIEPVDVALVLRGEVRSNPKDPEEQARIRDEYLTAQGHVNVTGTRKRRRQLSPSVILSASRVRPRYREVEVTFLEELSSDEFLRDSEIVDEYQQLHHHVMIIPAGRHQLPTFSQPNAKALTSKSQYLTAHGHLTVERSQKEILSVLTERSEPDVAVHQVTEKDRTLVSPKTNIETNQNEKQPKSLEITGQRLARSAIPSNHTDLRISLVSFSLSFHRLFSFAVLRNRHRSSKTTERPEYRR